MPNLHEELMGESKGGACKVCAFLSRLDPVTRAEWEREIALLNTKGEFEITHTAIVSVLRRRQVSIEEASVRRHRSNHVSAA